MQSVEKLSSVSAEEVNRMAYKDMNRTVYVSATLGFFALIVVGSIAITNISVVFNFVGALAVTAMVFWFPAFYFTQAVAKFKVARTKEVKHNIALSRLFWVLGAVNFSLSMFVAVQSVMAGG